MNDRSFLPKRKSSDEKQAGATKESSRQIPDAQLQASAKAVVDSLLALNFLRNDQRRDDLRHRVKLLGEIIKALRGQEIVEYDKNQIEGIMTDYYKGYSVEDVESFRTHLIAECSGRKEELGGDPFYEEVEPVVD